MLSNKNMQIKSVICGLKRLISDEPALEEVPNGVIAFDVYLLISAPIGSTGFKENIFGFTSLDPG